MAEEPQCSALSWRQARSAGLRPASSGCRQACSSRPGLPMNSHLVPDCGAGMLYLLTVTLMGSSSCSIAAERGLFPTEPSFSLCHWGPSLVAGWMCLDYPGLSAPSQAGTSQSGWLTRPPINDFHLVSPFTKIYSYFYIPSIWLAVSHKKPFKLFCCIFSLFTSFESELLYNT